jgi:hypothetical protein
MAKRTIASVHLEKHSRSMLAKYGARMAKTRRERLKNALRMLSEILTEVEPSLKAAAPPPAEDEKAKAKAKKSEEALAAANAKIAALEIEVKKGAERIAAVQKNAGQSQGSNAIPVDGVPPEGAAFSWPTDMNRNFRDTPDGDRFGLADRDPRRPNPRPRHLLGDSI